MTKQKSEEKIEEEENEGNKGKDENMCEECDGEEVCCEEAEEKIDDEKTNEEKSEENFAGWQRCQADFDNYKKRQADSTKNMMQYATEDMVVKLLPVLDNFHASIDHVPAEHAESPWVMGLGYIQKQLSDVLSESGVSEMTLAVGDIFDPLKHEAIKDDKKKEEKVPSEEECEEQESENASENSKDSQEQKITKIITRGYTIGDKVIRPARVVV